MALIDELKERRDEALNSATGYDAKAKEFANYAADFRAEAEELGRAIAALEPEREYISDGEHERAASTLPPGATYIKGPYFDLPQPSPDVQQEDRQQEAQAIPEGFVAWGGGEWTGPQYAKVEAIDRDGNHYFTVEEDRVSDQIEWRRGLGGGDIIAYRLLPPEETAKDGETVELPEGFRAWDGSSNCQYPTTELVEVIRRDSRVSTPQFAASFHEWFYAEGSNDPRDIISYRMVQSEENAKPADGPSSQELQHEQTPSETNNQQEDSLKGEGETDDVLKALAGLGVITGTDGYTVTVRSAYDDTSRSAAPGNVTEAAATEDPGENIKQANDAISLRQDDIDASEPVGEDA